MTGDELIPLVVQDSETKQVLSLFYCNRESIRLMKKTGFVWRFSRKAGKQVQKGASSGNVQEIVKLSKDCDGDAILAAVRQKGSGACHLGRWSCFTAKKARSWGMLDELCAALADRRKKMPKGSYVASLIEKPKEIGRKLKEEAAELEEAMLEKTEADVVWEAADLLFFTLVALESKGIDFEDVLKELKRRRH